MPSAFSCIVVATDFSPNAERALHWAVALAKNSTGGTHARIILVHAISTAATQHDLLEGPLAEQARKGMERGQKIASDASINVAVEQHRGHAWQVIATVAASHKADLIVIGSRGHTGYKELLLGSTADRLIRIATVPVLVIHPNDALPAPGKGLQSVLVPVDFSDESSMAASIAAQVLSATPSGGRIILLHVVELIVDWPTPDAPTIPSQIWEGAERDANGRLESLAASIRTDRVRVEARCRRGYPPDVIRHESKSGVDLIAMSTHGKSGIDRMLIGSVAERVLQHAACPVLVVRTPV